MACVSTHLVVMSVTAHLISSWTLLVWVVLVSKSYLKQIELFRAEYSNSLGNELWWVFATINLQTKQLFSLRKSRLSNHMAIVIVFICQDIFRNKFSRYLLQLPPLTGLGTRAYKWQSWGPVLNCWAPCPVHWSEQLKVVELMDYYIYLSY